MSSHLSHNPQEVLLAQFSIYVHKFKVAYFIFLFVLQSVGTSSNLFDSCTGLNLMSVQPECYTARF